MFENVADIHHMHLKDKITFDGNSGVFSPAGYVPDFAGGDRVVIAKFVTSGTVSGTPVGVMPYSAGSYDHDLLAYTKVYNSGDLIDEGGPGPYTLEITTTDFDEGEYYLIMIDSTGTYPASGARTIEAASVLFISPAELEVVGGSVAGVDLDGLKRMVSLMGAGVRLRDYTFENGYLAANQMAAFDYDDATNLSLALEDMDDDTYLDATYTVNHVIDQLGDIEETTSTKD